VAKVRACKKGLSGNEIKAELVRRGIKLIDIAKEAGVPPSRVTEAINERYLKKNHRIRKYIADALGMPSEKIWPDEQIKQVK
jgi:lambda repressor-like predicted transcriptional regulator